MKLNLILIGVGVLLIILVGARILGFTNNTSAAMVNGFIYGLVLTSIVNLVALKMKK